MISILGIVNAQLLFNPRVLFSMSRDGLFIRAGERVNRGGTPSVAMPLTALASIGFILSGKETAGRLSDIATFFFVLSYCSGFAAVLRLRRAEPDPAAPLEVAGVPRRALGTAADFDWLSARRHLAGPRQLAVRAGFSGAQLPAVLARQTTEYGGVTAPISLKISKLLLVFSVS
jgi:hypothetical protein